MTPLGMDGRDKPGQGGWRAEASVQSLASAGPALAAELLSQPL